MEKIPENIPVPKEQENRIEKVENKEITVEQFVELVLWNGELLEGSLTNSMASEYLKFARTMNPMGRIEKEYFRENPKGTYLFNGELYTVNFKAEKIDEYTSRSRNKTFYGYKMTPVAIEKLEVPTK